jgi:predicted  nucleic acid-binding Zn-ribbon protein
MDIDMSEVNERLARVEQGQVHQEKQLDKLVSVTEKLADVHIRMSSLEGKVEKHETKISQNEKQIAKYSLLFAILVGFLVRYFPELKAIVGL